MGVELLRASRAALPSSGLNIASRAAMAWLADAARDDTALAWLAQSTLADLVGCAPNYMGKVVAALEAAGMVSTWRRSGRVPLYLVHPAGAAALPPISDKAVRAHLREGKFSTADKRDVIAWLGSLGVMAAASVTPKLSLGVSRLKGAPPPNSVGGDPQTQFGPTPQLSLAEPKYNPKGTQTAERGAVLPAKRPHTEAAPLGPTAGSTMEMAQQAGGEAQEPKKTPEQAAKAARAISKRDWRGQPQDVLSRVIAAGGPEGDRLAAMSPEAALAAVISNQQLLRIRSVPLGAEV